MQQENNHLHWKQKLEDTTKVSAGQPFNKSVAWNKVQQRLQAKPKRRKTTLYWAAAACLLPLLIWLLIPAHQPQKSLVKNNHQDPVTTKPTTEDETPKHQQILVKKTTRSIIKKGLKKALISIAKADESKSKLPEASHDSATQPLRALTIDNSDSTIANIPPVASTKKKLQVVHINELTEPVEATPVLTHTISAHPFPFGIARGEAHGNNIKAIHTISFISLKTKPLSN